MEALSPPSAVLDGVKRKTITDRVQLPRLYMAWHTPGLLKPGDATMDIVANLLSSGKNSRLYRRLVYDLADCAGRRRVSAVTGARQQLRDHGHGAARPGSRQDSAVIDEELDKLRKEVPAPREMTRALNQTEASFYRSMSGSAGSAARPTN